jgi:YfiH family protein
VGGAAGPADAAITRQPGRVCAILTADCLPVLLASITGDRVGAAHAGWRGLAAGVIEAAVTALGGPPGELLAWLGPAIGPRHFEVGAEVREAFLRGAAAGGLGAAGGAGGGAVAEYAAAIDAAFAPNSRGRYLADLVALARLRLARAGVRRVYGGGGCTFAEPDKYFSHRRDGRTGRQATLIWLEGSPRR